MLQVLDTPIKELKELNFSHIPDMIYFTFAITYSLPLSGTLESLQTYISGDGILRIVQISHILSAKVIELIVIGLLVGKVIDYISREDLQIEELNVVDEIVTIRNNGKKTIKLKGYKIISVKTGRVFEFKEEHTIKGGEIVRVLSGNKEPRETTDIKWNNGNNWKNKGDTAILLDDTETYVLSSYKV
ncbi:lamin tail domain-containing protein [Bacillus thuringiensis]|uniref:lamin tail domain-containing protein n=1 Tax=Bacillus thuringiensis TaxID=1428 RepID=UPI0022489FC0|nr:lamin tail domain-containing protein [Bacillus thuringiensis]